LNIQMSKRLCGSFFHLGKASNGDSVQPARYALGEQIMPHPPGIVGAIACQEPGTFSDNVCMASLLDDFDYAAGTGVN
jgi:hypothetical protein